MVNFYLKVVDGNIMFLLHDHETDEHKVLNSYFATSDSLAKLTQVVHILNNEIT